MSEALFLSARAATDRGAFERFKKGQGIDLNALDLDARRQALEVLRARFDAQPLLLDPQLYAYTYAALAAARGRQVDGTQKFPATIWLRGAEKTYDGRAFLGTMADFARLLVVRAKELAPKRTGWVIEPTTNTDGHRTNESTTAMHALFLDCDGRGEWGALLAALDQLDFAYVAYQSGGWSPMTPKWRVVFPLTESFDTSDEEKQATWKGIYHHARVVVGSIARLWGAGFDAATDTPCCPWFLTERRDANDPERLVRWRPGHAFDLAALLRALPPVPVEVVVASGRREVVGEEGLTDDQLNALIDGLSKATVSVPSGRHELYLALPGALLDRGVPPDEVMAIIEEVSASYPRKHLDKHKDNIHNAKTTIAKWEAGGAVTQIGTLNDRWPEVARVLDVVLPNQLNQMLAENITALTAPPVVPDMSSAPTPIKKRRRKLTTLGKEVAPFVAQMKRSPNPTRRFGGTLIERILNGESFQTENSTPEQIDTLVSVAMQALGFSLPQRTTWQEVLDLANVTLLSMDFTQSVERVAAAERAFLKGQYKRRLWNEKQSKAINDFRSASAKAFQDAEALMKGSR